MKKKRKTPKTMRSSKWYLFSPSESGKYHCYVVEIVKYWLNVMVSWNTAALLWPVDGGLITSLILHRERLVAASRWI